MTDAICSGSVCAVVDCGRPRHSHGLCRMHVRRLKRNGDLERRRAEQGTGELRKDGYRAITAHGHPLADSRGRVLEHRRVLFDEIGIGPHACFHCGAPVNWGRSIWSDSGCLVVDHLDRDRSNNDPANLVAACNPCNCNSSKTHCVNGHPFNEENTRMYRGKRCCRACGRDDMRRRRALGRAA
jgi:hypothetical protein